MAPPYLHGKGCKKSDAEGESLHRAKVWYVVSYHALRPLWSPNRLTRVQLLRDTCDTRSPSPNKPALALMIRIFLPTLTHCLRLPCPMNNMQHYYNRMAPAQTVGFSYDPVLVVVTSSASDSRCGHGRSVCYISLFDLL
jgi:hypothetical protein